ncbi:putative SpoU family rRNA methylase [Bradyrhizobium sp. LM2.7]
MVLGDIGKTAGDQPFDDLAHLANMLGRARLDARPERAKRVDVGVKLLAGLLGDLADRLVQRQAGKIARGAVVDLVVDVGDVADIFDVRLAIEMAQ